MKILPEQLSGSYDIKDIYIQKVFRVEGHHWKVYVLAGFPRELIDSKEKFIGKPTRKPDVPSKQPKKKPDRVKWKTNYGPRAGATALSQDGQTIYASSNYSEGDLYAFDRTGNVKWKKQLQGNYWGEPTVGPDGNIYYSKWSGRGDEWIIYAFSPSGKKLWEYADNCKFKQGLAVAEDGTLYIGSFDGDLYALTAQGNLKWKKQLGPRLFAAPVVTEDGTIYQSGFNKKKNRGELFALKPDGSVKWTYRADGARLRKLSLDSDGNILVSDFSGGLRAVSPVGDLIWSAPIEERLVGAPVIGPEGTIYAATYGNELFAFTPEGNKKWSRALPGSSGQHEVRNTPVVDSEGYIYVTNYRSMEAGFLAAITPRGNLDWKIKLDGGGHQSGNLLLAKDGTILATTHTGSLYAVRNSTGKGLADSPWPAYQRDNQNTGRIPQVAKPSFKKGEVIWKNNYGPRAGATALSPDGQTIYASSHYSEGDLYVFDREGNVKWKKQLPGIYGGWPTVGPDGTLYYVKNTDAGDEWTIYAFSPEGKKLWEYADNCVFKRNLAVGPDGTLYVGSMKGRMGERMYALSPEGGLKWKKQLGSRLVAAPVVAEDGTVYQTGYNKNSNRSTLYALKPDGSVKWTYSVEGARLRNLSLDGDGNLLAGDLSGGIHAVSPTGKRLWTASTDERLQAAPVVGSDGTIYAAAHGNELFAFTPEGNKKWSRKLPGNSGQYEVRSTPVVDSEGYVYVTNYRSREAGFLAAITPRGNLDWKLELNGGGHQSGNLLLTKDGTILATTHTGSLYAVHNSTGKGLADSLWPAYQRDNQNRGRALPAEAFFNQQGKSGEVKWKFELPAPLPNPAALAPDGRTLYVRSGFGDGDLFAINSDGSKKWQVELEGSRNGSVPAVGADGIIYVGGAESGNFYAVNPDGSIRWQTDIGGRIRGSPALGPDGTVYVSSDEFHALSPTGETKWTFPGQGSFITAAALGTDGTIYVGDENYLWALTPGGDVKWNFKVDFKPTEGSPALGADGTVYVSDKSGKLYALGRGGKVKWSFNTGAAVRQQISVGPQEKIYVGTQAGEVFALGPLGDQEWKFSAPDLNLHVTSVPTHAADGTIYVNMTGPNSAPESKIFALSPEGELKWSVTNDGRFKGDPAIGPAGTLYVGSGYRSSTPGLWAIHTSGATLAKTPWPGYQFDNQSTGRQSFPRSED